MAGQILGLDHLGVASKDPKARMGLWADLLGLPLEKVEDVESEGVRTWFLDMGGGHLELLEPTSENSPIAKHIEKRGEGIAHLALRVDGMDALLARLAAKGIVSLPPGVRTGAGGAKVCFLHPKETGGVLLELRERDDLGHPDLDDEDVFDAGSFDDDDDDMDEPFGEGTIAVLYLREPKERLFGVIHQLDSVGIAFEGVDLDSFESWVNQWTRGEDGPIAPSLQFFPMHRLEKAQADSDLADLPSFTRRFEDRTGHALAEAFGLDIDEDDDEAGA